MMLTVHTILELRQQLNAARRAGKKIAFVPTMGNLHRGHMSLVEEAVRQADLVVASIFVNPLQFGANEDLDSYPRTLEKDQSKLDFYGCNLLFAPSAHEMYPRGSEIQTVVGVRSLSDLHCGERRPTHFRGVATVVTKLFGIVQPDCAVFGKKDYQQLAVIQQLTEDLSLPVEIIGVATGRANSGLALSSRNGYLTESELTIAPILYDTLHELATQLKQGERTFQELEERANQHLESNGFVRDYIHICRQSDLRPAAEGDHLLVILAAAHLGAARLIDNLEVILN
jgi:pantoate--beta-alanine ligase